MHMYFHELKSYRRHVLVWTASLVAITLLFMSMYPTFARDVSASKQTLQALPLAVRQSLNLLLDYFFTLNGFYAYMLTFVGLAAAVQATILGLRCLGRESTAKTTDFLFAKPVGRLHVLYVKLGAVMTILLVESLVFMTASVAMAYSIQSSITATELRVLLLLAGSVLLMQCAFVAIGGLVSVLLRRMRSAAAIALPVVFGFFLIGVVSSMTNSQLLAYASPFRYFGSNYILLHHAYDGRFLFADAGVIVGSLALTSLVLNKKDIRSEA